MALENIRNKRVFIQLDRKREILFDLNALAELQEVYGSFEKAIADLRNEKLSIKAIRALLYSGLKHEDENLTIKQAGSLVKFHQLGEVNLKINQALAANFPDPSEEIYIEENEDGFIQGDAPVKKK